MDNLPPPDMGCHLTGFQTSCRSLVTRKKNCCRRWMQIQGHNPNTGEPVNRFDCIDNWTPILLIENSQMQRQTGAAVESFRNEVVRSSDAAPAVMIEAQNGQRSIAHREMLPQSKHQDPIE
jgi:hypothetical protein